MDNIRGQVVLTSIIEHGGLELMDRKEGWTLLQAISCCNRFLYEYIKQRMTVLRMNIMGVFVTDWHGSRITRYMKNNKFEGIMRTYCNDHEYPDEHSYKNGLRHGQTRVYYRHKPTLMHTVTYKDGKAFGLTISYFANGVISHIEMVDEKSLCNHRIYYNPDNTVSSDNWEFVENYHRALKKQKT